MRKIVTGVWMLVCIAMGVGRWLDLVNYTDTQTGFLTGSHLLRYLILLVAVLGIMATSFYMPQKSRNLMGQCAPQGWLAALTGVVFAALGGLVLVQPENQVWDFVLAALWLACGVWMLLLARSRFTQEFEAPTTSSSMGIVGTLGFYILTIQQFAVQPTGIARISPTICGLTTLVCLVFCTGQVRMAYVPGGKTARYLWRYGLMAFLFATCLNLPDAVFWYWMNEIQLIELLQSVALAVVGLMGLVYAFTLTEPSKAIHDQL